MSKFANRSEINFVNSMVDAIFAEADRCNVNPRNVLLTVRDAFENKQRCFEIAQRSGTHAVNLAQFYDPALLENLQSLNCRCVSKGVWGGQVEPQKIVYSGNRTIVFWNDGTKTIVKLRDGDEFDEYLGFIAAYAKKMFGSTHKLKKLIKSISHYNKKKEPKKATISDETEN